MIRPSNKKGRAKMKAKFKQGYREGFSVSNLFLSSLSKIKLQAAFQGNGSIEEF